MTRSSYQDEKQAFVDLQPVGTSCMTTHFGFYLIHMCKCTFSKFYVKVGTNIIQYLEEEQRRQCPHVLHLGDKVNCSQAFVIVGGGFYKQWIHNYNHIMFWTLNIPGLLVLFGSFYNIQYILCQEVSPT